MIEQLIIRSLLDSDLYTFTVGQVAFLKFRTARVRYAFINRSKTEFPPDFANQLRHQLDFLSQLRLTNPEAYWLKMLEFFKDEYIDYLKSYQFDPSQVIIDDADKNLSIFIDGTWVDVIMWEVPLLALISELYYKMIEAIPDREWQTRLENKAKNLSDNGCNWIDFGTRRRFSFDVQNAVVDIMKGYKGFGGTSNCYLAMIHGVSPKGTMSHQGPMAMMAKYGVHDADKMWRQHWEEIYKDKLLVYLPDAFTTDNFLKRFTKEEAERWSGLRQDSGNPDEWMDKILAFYKKMDVNTKDKTFIFSDSLTDEKYKKLSIKYRQYANIVGGIGTFLSNDCGHKALSIVIKLSMANFGKGNIPVIKLSDDKGKNTGDANMITCVKAVLQITT